MAITKDKVASLLLFTVLAVVAVTMLESLRIPGFSLLPWFIISSFGLALIWFAEPLGEIASFSRGIPLRSPPVMIEAFGWLFLLGYPLFLAWVVF